MAILDRFEIDSVEYEFQDQKSHNLAAQYSTSATYAVGDYCIKDGDLYKCITAITTAEAWTAAHWTAAQIAPDLTSQSEKIDDFEKNYVYKLLVSDLDGKWVQGGLNVNTGASTTSANVCRIGANMRDNKILHIECDEGYRFIPVCYDAVSGSYIGCYQADGTYVKGTSAVWWKSWDVSTIGNNRYSIMAGKDPNSPTTPSDLISHIRFYKRSALSNDIITEYASDNKNIVNVLDAFEPGGIGNTGTYYDGNAEYQASTLRTSFIKPTCDVGDIIYFESLAENVSIRLYIYDSAYTFKEYIGYDSKIAYVHEAGNKYKVVFQKSTGGALIPTITIDEVWKNQRIYVIKNPVSKIVSEPNKGIYCIMSHNVGQWFNGSGSVKGWDGIIEYTALHKSIIDRYRPDILCTQEYTPRINLLGEYYNDFYQYNPNGNIYSGKCIATNYEQSDKTSVLYTEQPSTAADGARNLYSYSYVWLNGKKICVITTHLAPFDVSMAESQMDELMTFAQTQDYVIICGDFNLDCRAVTDTNYIEAFKPWIDAGYNMANYSDWGFMVTGYNTLSDDYAIDNIITSGNIEIKYACVDYQKKDAELDEKIDHMPIIAYVEIN